MSLDDYESEGYDKYYEYENNGWEDAIDDEDYEFRIKGYESLDWPDEALEDEDEDVRFSYYKYHGFKENCKEDDYWRIRDGYYKSIYYKDKAAKYDEDHSIRLEYYKSINYQDEDAMSDKCHSIREPYYTNNPDKIGEKARNDESSKIRLMYFHKFGFLSECLSDERGYGLISHILELKKEAFEYFKECSDILGHQDLIKLKFTEDEAVLLEMNNIIVNKHAIIGGK